MAATIKNLFYSEKDIGATLKLTKRQFIWEFDLNGSHQRLELLDSRVTRKKRLYKNGVSILETTENGNFIHNFEIDGHACIIIQYGDKIELRIDNQSFTHLYNLQKNKDLFAGEKGPTSNIYIAKPYDSYGSSNEDTMRNNGSAFYKVNKPGDENKPKLFNFEIKKDTSTRSRGFSSKFKFGDNKGFNNPNTSNSNNNQQNINNNTNSNANNGSVDLLGFQENPNMSNTNNSGNGNGSNNMNNMNNNLLDFGMGNSNTNTNANANVNNTNNNQNNQNQQKNGNDIFDLFGSNNNNNNQNQNQNNINGGNQNNNNNPFNNFFLPISDGTNQQPQFDQNNLGFMGINSNNNMNMNMNNFMNNNNNFNNGQNQQMGPGINQNNNNTNAQNNGGIDLLNF